MLSKLRCYPRIIYMLVFYLVIEQSIYGYLSTWSYGFKFTGEWQPSLEALNATSFLSGFAALLAGWLADQFRSISQGLLTSIGLLLVSSAISLLPYELTYLLGHFVVETASFLFFFLVVWHIAILFPVATDWKDNAFMLLFVATLLSGFVLALLSLLGLGLGVEEELMRALIPFGLAVMLILLLYYDKDIGFDISADADVEETEPGFGKWPILIGCTAIIFTVNFAAVALEQISGNQQLYFTFDLFDYYNWWWLSLLGSLLMIVVVILLIYFANGRSNHFFKLQWALVAIFSVFGLEMLVRHSGSFELSELSSFMSRTVQHMVIYPVLLAVLTHVNLDNRTGLWLGIFYGVPSLLVTGLSTIIPSMQLEGLLQPVIALVLLIVVFIFLRENKQAILEVLALEEPNQAPGDEDPEQGEDPIDHLIAGD